MPLLGIDARLRERSFGVFEGLTREECEALHPEHWRRYLEDRMHLPPGAEPVDDVVRRMRDAIEELAGAAAGPALVVTHGSAMRQLVMAVTRAACPPLRNGEVFRLTLVADGGERARLIEAAPLEGPPRVGLE